MTMKKSFAAVLFLVCCLTVSAQEKKMTAGLGAEWSMDFRQRYAGGAVINFDYKLGSNVALGVVITGTTNISNLIFVESAILMRGYFLGTEHTGPFVQEEIGVFLTLDNFKITPLVETAVRVGYRMPLGSSFYLELYGRVGYPFIFGFGAIPGFRF